MIIKLAPRWQLKLFNYSNNSKLALGIAFLAGLSSGFTGKLIYDKRKHKN